MDQSKQEIDGLLKVASQILDENFYAWIQSLVHFLHLISQPITPFYTHHLLNLLCKD